MISIDYSGFSGGCLLLTRLDPARYRLIMSDLELAYVYQVEEDIFSESRFDSERMATEVVEPLKTQEQVTVNMESRLFDKSGREIALAHTTCQVKRWGKVRPEV